MLVHNQIDHLRHTEYISLREDDAIDGPFVTRGSERIVVLMLACVGPGQP